MTDAITGEPGPGRRSIDDALDLVLFVEVGRRRDRAEKMSVREFVKRRDVRYFGPGVVVGGPGCTGTLNRPREVYIRGEALRRRFGKSRERIGIADQTKDGDGNLNPATVEARDTVDRMIRDFLNGAA